MQENPGYVVRYRDGFYYHPDYVGCDASVAYVFPDRQSAEHTKALCGHGAKVEPWNLDDQ